MILVLLRVRVMFTGQDQYQAILIAMTSDSEETAAILAPSVY